MARFDIKTPFDDFGDEPEQTGESKKIELSIVDGGYFDTLVAIGLAALIESYFDLADSPLIEWTAKGFIVSYKVLGESEIPALSWLRFSIPKDWRTAKKNPVPVGQAKKLAGWDKRTLTPTDGIEVDTSKDLYEKVEIDGKTIKLFSSSQSLYRAINKLGKADWFNLCVYSCREKGKALIEGTFKASSISFNSMVLPQASKGASGSDSFSIDNVKIKLSSATTADLGRYTCLAVAGIIIAANGQIPQKQTQGFAVPVPESMRLRAIKRIAEDNRNRRYAIGFFFNYDNYLGLLYQLLQYNESVESNDENPILRSVAGASFIDLGQSPSPSASWQLMVPKHRYSSDSVYHLQRLLNQWKAAKTNDNYKLSINRAAVAELMRGFEYSDPFEVASGYLGYIFDVGLLPSKEGTNRVLKIYPLTQVFFEEMMETNYQDLLTELREGEIKPFIDLVRRETYEAVFPLNSQDKIQPNFQMIRSLREVQNKEDFITAITEIAIERGVTKLATANNANSKAGKWSPAKEASLARLIQMVESGYKPKLLANLILAFALSTRSGKKKDNQP